MSTCNGMVFELNGARALSDFRAARVLAALQRVSSNIEAVSGRFVHFVHASRELTKAEEERLASLLTYGDAAEDVRADLAFMVVPRLGTISPWASKATDIVKNCGIEGVLRVERGTVYSLALKAPLTQEVPLVTPGLLPVFVHAFPAKLLMKVDFPTFGIPTIIARIGRFKMPLRRSLSIFSLHALWITSLTCFTPFPCLELTKATKKPFFS